MQLESLDQWLGWLERNHPKEIDLGLERVALVAGRMQLLQPKAKVITVAGTNGKGSCVATISALLQAAGHQVGIYTSPHLLAYNERIAINGKPVSDAEICSAFTQVYSACSENLSAHLPSISLTYFEYGTLAALEIFKRRQVTAMVLEVGMGGRLDAVNIIDPDVAIITSIALDHTEWLGKDREAIGREKAGIMRPDKPVVCSDFDPPNTLIDHAVQLRAQPYFINKEFGFSQLDGKRWNWWSSNYKACHQPEPQLPLPSVAAALQAAQLLGLDLRALDAFNLVARLAVPGRFQRILWQGRVVIADVAHNPAATKYLAERLAQEYQAPAAVSSPPQQRRLHAVVGMMSDKDRLRSLANLKDCVEHWYIAELTDVPRAASVTQIQQDLDALGLSANHSGTVADCLQAAFENSAVGDLILVFGSFYTVAAALKVVT